MSRRFPRSSGHSAAARRIRPSAAMVVIAAWIGLSAGGGCGYQVAGDYSSAPQPGYQWRSLYRQDIQTVAVPIFVNRTFSHGIELALTKAVIKQLEANAPYKVVAADKADTILEGEVTAMDIRTLSRDRSADVPQEQLGTLQVNFLWKDLRTGRVLAQRTGFEQTAAYYPTLGEGRWYVQQLSVEKLALAIVQELAADW